MKGILDTFKNSAFPAVILPNCGIKFFLLNSYFKNDCLSAIFGGKLKVLETDLKNCNERLKINNFSMLFFAQERKINFPALQQKNIDYKYAFRFKILFFRIQSFSENSFSKISYVIRS